MVRQGPVVRLAAGLALVLMLAGDAAAQPAGAKPSVEPIDRRPYKIQAHVTIDPEARIDARGRTVLLAAWRSLVRRFVGAPWDLSIAEPGGSLSAVSLDGLAPSAFATAAAGFDKLWVFRVGRQRSGLTLSGREFDTATDRLGPVHRRIAPFVTDAPRDLLRLALEVFAPSAEIGPQAGGGVSLTVRGASLGAASPVGRVVAVGSVFRPIRLVAQKDGQARALDIPFTYLRVVSLDGPIAHCAIVSALRDPLTQRMARKNTLAAVGIKPGADRTRLRFVTQPEKAPAAGYVLTARDDPDGLPVEVGTTDREGRISLEPGTHDGLVILRLLAGNIEPMVELPLMPGETAEERTIPFVPKPLTVALETQLDSLRDAILDLVAIRARLEARLKARYDGEDWTGVEETLKEYSRLPARETFANQLTKLKDDAAHQQAQTKSAVLTKTAQAQLAEVQALIDRYLDDEVFKGFADSLARSRAGPEPKAKDEAKKKAAVKPAGTLGPKS